MSLSDFEVTPNDPTAMLKVFAIGGECHST